jgi:signal transduction histidine kinase/ActR/RegA family two-component response regulator
MTVSSTVCWAFSVELGWLTTAEQQDDVSLVEFQRWCDRELLRLRDRLDGWQGQVLNPNCPLQTAEPIEFLFREIVELLSPSFWGDWSLSEKEGLAANVSEGLSAVQNWHICLEGDDPHFSHSIALQAARQDFLDRVSVVFSHQVRMVRSMQTLLQDCQTFQRQNQELEQISQLKSEFLANTSHEIRTPLSSILGFTHLLREQGFNPGAVRHQEYLRIILTSGQHLSALINDILDLSKIEANQLDLNWEIVEIEPLCQTIVMLVQEKANDHGLQLKLEILPKVKTLFCDPLRLKQMLFNLLSNALKFTKEGTVGLRVEQDEGMTRFTVWDTGVGIPESQINLLFRPYQQLPHTASRQAEGTGLGLALTQKLAELHYGSVQVTSELDRGSRFTVQIPILSSILEAANLDAVNPNCNDRHGSPQPPIVHPVAISSPIDGTSANRFGSKILVVEDNFNNAQLLIAFLCKLGYEVTWAKNHTDLWRSLQQERPAVILMDINLPDVDGLTIIRELRAKPDYATLPIIAQTALAMSGDRALCLEAGATDYLTKPLDLKRLAQVLSCYSKPLATREPSED